MLICVTVAEGLPDGSGIPAQPGYSGQPELKLNRERDDESPK
jgi:hypothetical protein